MAGHGDGSVRVVLVAVLSNGMLCIAKVIGWVFSMSPSMLAEAIHSFADVANQFLLYVGIRHGRKPPNTAHPLGYGSARYVWNLISAMGIFFVGFGVTTYHGVHALVSPGHTSSVNPWIPISILILALVTEGYSWLVALSEINASRGKRSFLEMLRTSDDPTILSVLLEDSVAVLGVFAALTGLLLSKFLHSQAPDAIASIFIGVLLGLMAVILAMSNSRLLIGAAIQPRREGEVRDFLAKLPGVERIESLRTEVLAPGRVLLSTELELEATLVVDRKQIEHDVRALAQGEEAAQVLTETAMRALRRVGKEINSLETLIQERFPEIVRIDLEVN